MPNYQTRLERIQAVQWNGRGWSEAPAWLEIAIVQKSVRGAHGLFFVCTSRGNMPILDGDWLIKREDGSLSVVGAGEFASKYEVAA